MSGTIATRQEQAERFVERSREVATNFRDRAAETEALRSLPPASVEELLDAGFARALVPERFGGMELDWASGFEATREIAKVDASHAWCAALMLLNAQFAACLPLEAQEELWGAGPDVPVASTVLPLCDVEREGDGFRVSGRAPFASGINHSAWTFVAGFVEAPDKPQWTLFLLPPTAFEVVDTWNTIGMRGTGSNTVVTDDVYVPSTHALLMTDLRDGTGAGSLLYDAPLYRLPWLSFGPLSFVGPMLGATQGAYESLRDWTRARVTKSGSAMADLPTVQLKLAHAAADIDAADLLIRRAVQETLGPEPPTLDLRARSMRDFARAGQLLVGSIDALVGLAGSAGFSESNAIQRAWRDVHFMSSHISMNDSNPIHWARMELGLGPAPRQVQY